MQPLPESPNTGVLEICQRVNEIVRLLSLIQPNVTDTLGQSAPQSADVRAGQIAFADGSNWSPGGAGASGLYQYLGGQWVSSGTSAASASRTVSASAAASATNAYQAASATNAYQAASATNAYSATNSYNAGSATNAYSASNATNAGSATNAASAGAANDLIMTGSGVVIQSGTNTTTRINFGSLGQLFQMGASIPQWTSASAITVGAATSAASADIADAAISASAANDIIGGTARSLLYQSAAGNTNFLASGVSGQVLEQGSAFPQWKYTSGISAGYATDAGSATNALNATNATSATNAATANYAVSAGSVTGGIASATFAQSAGTAFHLSATGTGAVLYQSGTNNTKTIPLGTLGYLFMASSTTPVWTAASALNVGSAGSATNALNATNATSATNAASATTALSATNAVSATNALSAANAASATNCLSGTNAYSASVATNAINASFAMGAGYCTCANQLYASIATAGCIPYQTATAATNWLPKGVSGQVLEQGSNYPQWKSPSAFAFSAESLSAGWSTYALSASAAGIAPSYASGVSDGTYNIRTKVVPVGAWNMDSTATASVAHGLTLSNILAAWVWIVDDTGANIRPINFPETTGYDYDDGYYYITTSNVELARRTNGVFDSTSYDSTAASRGWITILHKV